MNTGFSMAKRPDRVITMEVDIFDHNGPINMTIPIPTATPIQNPPRNAFMKIDRGLVSIVKVFVEFAS